MHKYEIMFIVRPDLEETSIKKVASEVKKILTDNHVKSLEEKEMGQRELAYEINKHKTGYYYLFTFETDDVKAINEFNHISKINENIIRSLVIKVGE